MLSFSVRHKIIRLTLSILLIGLISLTIKISLIQPTNASEMKGDFVLSPAKIEVDLLPGESIVRSLTVINQTEESFNFRISKEDFEGSLDTAKPTVFLGQEKGRFSCKDWLKPEIEEFSLKAGQKIDIRIAIEPPQGIQPGGYYAAIFITRLPHSDNYQTETKIISRLGSLFFVKVKGAVMQETGFLKDFRVSQFYYQKGPVEFEILSRNSGNVHLIPYGVIEIRNVFGKKIAQLGLDPWFVLPDSVRLRKISWQRESLFGLFKATAKINRGYQNIIDEQSLFFVVMPWPFLLFIIIGCGTVILIFGVLLKQALKKQWRK